MANRFPEIVMVYGCPSPKDAPATRTSTLERYQSVLVQTSRGPVPIPVYCLLVTTPELQTQGYRGRPEPANDHEGILFCFPTDVQPPINMEGVPFDLELFVGDARGLVTGGTTLRALDSTPQTPKAAIRFALEVRSGFTSRQGHPVRIALP